MQLVNNWERNSTVKNKPRRILIKDSSKYFFPIAEQPLCIHPIIAAMGEEVVNSILVQSAYFFMQNILINETEVVCKITQKIIHEKAQISLSDEMVHQLLTVIVDETYHAYIAHDFILQVSNLTNIKPIVYTAESSLTRSINFILEVLPENCHLFFEIIALCIAENSITKELVTTIKDPDVNIFFNEINADHLIDEGRHCVIFTDLLTKIWLHIPEERKKIIGACLPDFICKYLSCDVKKINDRRVLSNLNIENDVIEEILNDTHQSFEVSPFYLNNPIVKNILSLLKKSKILDHLETSQAFLKFGFLEEQKVTKNENSEHDENYADSTFAKISSGLIDFLRPVEKNILPEKQLNQSITLNFDINPNVCKKLILSYLNDVTNNITEEDKTSDIFANNSLGKKDNSIFIFFSESFISEKIHPEDLQLHIYKDECKFLKIKIIYNSKFYDKCRVDEFLENISYYINLAINNPSCHLKNLPLVSPKQKEHLLLQAKRKPENIDINETVISLFKNQVINYPSQVAVMSENETLTYKQLDHLSDIVAYNLEKLGLSSESVIVIIHNKTNNYIPIILGIMKAKMIFIPLSPKETDSRLQHMLNEINAQLIISDSENIISNISHFSCIHSLKIIALENQSADISSQSLYPYKSNLTAEDLAYIIYTSGTSGMPKGAMITHASLIHFAKSAARVFPIKEGDKILQFCPFNFDASLADICVSLISGASICLYNQKLLSTSSHFFEICQQYKITNLNLPATFWGQIVQDMILFSLKLPESLKTVVIGGEALAPAILDQWFQFSTSDIRILNTYGPTEATIAVTACELNNYKSYKNPEKIIGQSFKNSLLFVLDNHDRILPIGAIGELYIGGLGVSQGYFKRPDLTEKSFIYNLNSINKDLPITQLVYKTGDKVRWINENTLEFIGRSDRQVKINGIRIELSEIEYLLNKHPLVESSFVINHKKGTVPFIAAFVITKSHELREKSVISASIKKHIMLKIPEHMQPKYIQILKKWPLNNQGKIDKSQLIDFLSLEENFQEIKNIEKDFIDVNSLEVVLKDIWQSLLGVQEVSAKSHFFELGGHSLLAMRLIAHIKQEAQIHLTVREVLENPNFNCMLNLIQHRKRNQTACEEIKTGATSGPLSFSQEALWVLHLLQNGKSINYNIAYALHLKGSIDPFILEEAVNYIIDRQWILRSIFKKDIIASQNVIPQRVILRPKLVSLEIFRELSLESARIPFDLSNNPPILLQLFQIDPKYFILFVNHHHIIHDAYSINIFIKELSSVYNSFLYSAKISLPKLQRQFVDYADWQRSSENTTVTKDLDFWSQQLKNYKPICLPFRKTKTHLNPSAGDSYYFSLDSDITLKLKTICSQNDCTLFVGFLAIMNLLLHRYSGENDIAFATAMSTRDHQIDEHLIGMFVNVIILRNQLQPECSFVSLLDSIKKTLIEATTHRFTPLELISRSMNLQRMTFCHTLVDIIVNYHNFDDNFAKFIAKDVHSKIEFIDNKTSKFGLSFDIYNYNKLIDIKIEFSKDLYEFSSIKKISEDFIFLTDSLTKM